MQVIYGYDTASRLQVVSNGVYSATYSYAPNSPLVGNITFAQNGTTKMVTTKQWDNLKRLADIVSTVNSVPVGKSDYAYNAANQRTRNTHRNEYGHGGALRCPTREDSRSAVSARSTARSTKTTPTFPARPTLWI